MSKTAYVLTGGGAKGSFQAGVISQLDDAGIIPHAIYGTSVGSINALAYSYLGPKELVNWWLDLKGKKEVLNPYGWKWLYGWVRLFYKDGLHSTKPLRKVLTNAVRLAEEAAKQKSMNIKDAHFSEAIACFVDLRDGLVKYKSNKNVTSDEFVDSVISSCSIPMMMDTNKGCVDGGAREHTPLKKAIADGYDEIYVILASPFNMEVSWKNKSKFFPWFNVLYRAVNDCMVYEIFDNDLKPHISRDDIKLHIYAPDRYWMSTLDFDPNKIKVALEAGKNTKELIF